MTTKQFFKPTLAVTTVLAGLVAGAPAAWAIDDYTGPLPIGGVENGRRLVYGQYAEDGFPGPDAFAVPLYTTIGDRKGWKNYSVWTARSAKKYGGEGDKKVKAHNKRIGPNYPTLKKFKDGTYKAAARIWFPYEGLFIPLDQILTLHTDGREKPYSLEYSIKGADIRRNPKKDQSRPETPMPKKVWLSEPADFAFTEADLWGTGTEQDWRKASWRDYGFEHKVVIHGLPELITARFVFAAYDSGNALMVTKFNKAVNSTKADIDRVFKEMVP